MVASFKRLIRKVAERDGAVSRGPYIVYLLTLGYGGELHTVGGILHGKGRIVR